MVYIYICRYLPKPNNNDSVGKGKMAKKETNKKFSWKKFLLGLEKPAVTLIAAGLTMLAGQPQFAWVGGISAAAVWGTAKWYVKEHLQ